MMPKKEICTVNIEDPTKQAAAHQKRKKASNLPVSGSITRGLWHSIPLLVILLQAIRRSIVYQSFTLSDFAEKSKANFDRFRTSFPDTFLAGESQNRLFNLLAEHLVIPKPGELWQEEIPAMLFGCSSSWAHSFTATAGLDEHGTTSIRRSIEFTCYIAKIKIKGEGQTVVESKRKQRKSA
jgi:hypothetical protein